MRKKKSKKKVSNSLITSSSYMTKKSNRKFNKQHQIILSSSILKYLIFNLNLKIFNLSILHFFIEYKRKIFFYLFKLKK